MQLCVALDHPEKEANLQLVKELKWQPIWMKVGFRSFIRDGANFLEEIKMIDSGFKIFLDLKLYDIPNTMADASEEIAKLPVDLFNLHASSGEKGMQTVMERLNVLSKRPLVIAVTALTSFSDTDFQTIYHTPLEDGASEMAVHAFASGLDGVVCSAWESLAIKSQTHSEFLTITPGIRPFPSEQDDQERVADLNAARQNACDMIVVGRPIYQAEKPAEAVSQILGRL